MYWSCGLLVMPGCVASFLGAGTCLQRFAAHVTFYPSQALLVGP